MAKKIRTRFSWERKKKDEGERKGKQKGEKKDEGETKRKKKEEDEEEEEEERYFTDAPQAPPAGPSAIPMSLPVVLSKPSRVVRTKVLSVGSRTMFWWQSYRCGFGLPCNRHEPNEQPTQTHTHTHTFSSD